MASEEALVPATTVLEHRAHVGHALPRWLHPGAWWIWALAMATAASRTTNPWLLLLIVGVVALVVRSRRPEAPWARSFRAFLMLGLFVIAMRVVFGVLLGSAVGSHVLVTLPEVPLPELFAGVRLGGPITAESFLSYLYEGMRLATLLICIGAANSLASPNRLLKYMPSALYELGVAVVVGLTFAPQLVNDAIRIRGAQRLRGRDVHGISSLRSTAIPVFEGSLERAVNLAAAMDAKGYGRSRHLPPSVRRMSAGLVMAGLVGIVVGLFGLLDAGSPGLLGLPLLALGLLLALAGMGWAGKRTRRSRYRPDPWRLPEWLVTLSGVVPAVVLIASASSLALAAALAPPATPLAAPGLPWVPALAILVGMLPAVAAPPLPFAVRSSGTPRPGPRTIEVSDD